ncbi:conserved Plasmodium protein, unknown function [Plasmodium ovale]|uniref:Uncharacterized protein n=2 Tax=Plasmodium ovale TaxID=36330 RepID=A0A1A8VQ47_PLAOA|nr:hypothetical protein, conserved [Plasmodium ovale curtisi]SBS84576.1 hypothetical protein, conserved [Plasmodium ovale curtisi]SCQ16024.1 conserved Plasmodium protein, unknown function [Plasmodium ovale]
MKDEEKNVNYIKEFIRTFYFAKNVEIVIDESTLKKLNKTPKENNSSVINLYSCYSVWLCMNEIYPSWFDISIHPAQFDSELDAYECLLKYLNEYHENKFERIIKKIIGNLLSLTIHDFIDIYSLVILAALVSDDKQKHINNILSLNHETQKYIHNIVEILDKEENTNKETKLLTQGSFSKDMVNMNESMKNEIKQLKEKVKYLEIENENLTNSLAEKNKTIEENNEKMDNLQKQINAASEKTKNQYITQIEEQEKKFHELQNSLEKQIKDKCRLENDFKNKIKELEDEQNILKQENLNIENLQNKISKYKEKLDSLMTVQNINKQLENKLKNNTQKMIDMENEVQKLKIESNNMKMYQDRCSDFDAQLANTKSECEKLKQDVEEKNKTLQKLKNDLEAKNQAYDLLKKEQNFNKINIGLSNVDQTEELMRLKKENENLKKQVESGENQDLIKVKELENEVDNLKRINKELENKILESSNTENTRIDQKEQEKYEKSMKEVEEKQKEVEEKQKEVEGKQKEVEGKYKEVEEKQKEVEGKQKEVEEKQKEVEEKQEKLKEKQKEVEEKQKEVEEKQKEVEEKKKEVEEKQQEIKELRETNQMMKIQLSKMQGNGDSSIKEKIIRLEAELLMEKKNSGIIEESTKNKLSKEFNSALQIFKEQLQIREKETEYYKDALKTQIDISKDEQKLLSDIIHSLGLKYKQLQTYNLSLKNEIIGIKLRTQACSEPEKR